MRSKAARPIVRVMFAALLLVAALAMVAQLGSVQHLHAGAKAGLYNAEHDLTLLAALAGHGLTPNATRSLALEPVSIAIVPLPAERPAMAPASCGGSRAPPSA
jgi:hypothetical protein